MTNGPDSAGLPSSTEPLSASATLTWVNGARGELVSPLDRGLSFGDGVFETIACRAGRPRFLSLHLERLVCGCSRLQIPLPDPEELRREIQEIARDADRSIIKLIVTRGMATARGYGSKGQERATRICIRYEWPLEDAAQSRVGVKVCRLALRLGENPGLAGLKHCNRLEQILARAEWSDPEIAEGLLFSRSGNLISGTFSNVFLVNGSRLRTPRIDLCGVAGVMRRVVMREAARNGLETEESALKAGDLESADEVFLTNARIGIWPVCAIDSRVLPPGPITRRIQQLIEPLLDEPVDA